MRSSDGLPPLETNRYTLSRREVLPFVPTTAKSLLDVGCASGRFGSLLRGLLPDVELWGIEPELHLYPDVDMAYDTVIGGHFPDNLPERHFDCVVFNDVLEHLTDPWTVLAGWEDWLSPTGRIVASIPNIRHLTVLYKLSVRGEWHYQETGLLDRTHLRFFTRSSIIELFHQANLNIDQMEPLNLPRSGPLGVVKRMTGSRLTDLLALQFVVVASPRT